MPSHTVPPAVSRQIGFARGERTETTTETIGCCVAESIRREYDREQGGGRVDADAVKAQQSRGNLAHKPDEQHGESTRSLPVLPLDLRRTPAVPQRRRRSRDERLVAGRWRDVAPGGGVRRARPRGRRPTWRRGPSSASSSQPRPVERLEERCFLKAAFDRPTRAAAWSTVTQTISTSAPAPARAARAPGRSAQAAVIVTEPSPPVIPFPLLVDPYEYVVTVTPPTLDDAT